MIDTEQFDAHIQGPWVAVWSDTYAAKLGIEGPTYDARGWANDYIVSILVAEEWARQWSAGDTPRVDDEGLTVACLDVSHVDDSEWDYGQEYSSTQGTNREMYDATARLIAAAPDLLAEVKRLREDLLTYQPPEGFDWDDEHPRYSIEDWVLHLSSSTDLAGYWEWVNFQIDIEDEEEE